MSLNLPIQDNSRWHTLVAHTKRVGFVVLAGVVHLITHVRSKSTVLTLSVSWVTLLALFTHLYDPVVKALMLKNCLVCLYAIGTLASRRMCAQIF